MLLNPNCSEIILRLGKYTKEQILRELKKIGIIEFEILQRKFFDDNAYEENEKIKLLADRDNPNVPDFDENATLLIDDDKDLYDEIVIEAFQHTEKQLYPTMLKINEHFKKNFPDFTEEWIGHDGGWEGMYKEWIEAGKPEIKDYQNDKSKKLRKKYCKFI